MEQPLEQNQDRTPETILWHIKKIPLCEQGLITVQEHQYSVCDVKISVVLEVWTLHI